MEQKADDLKTNPKNFYNVFKLFLHSKSRKCENTLLTLDIDGVIERDQCKIADHFAKYFSSVANDIGNTRLLGMSEDQLYHHESVHTITQSCNRRPSDDTSQFKFHALEHKEISVELSNLDSNKSTGHDVIPTKILKTASRELSHPLADLYNRYIESCDWILRWKKGDRVPVFKKDNKQDIKNYRPVIVLTLAGQNPYPSQCPHSRAVPLWGGLSEGGFHVVAFHKARKFTTEEWCNVVRRGKLKKAIQALEPIKPHGPWKVLCDNEAFLHTASSRRTMAAEGITVWSMPASSPDLNPVEKFWAWLRKRIHHLDRKDLREKRPAIGMLAFKARVRAIISSRRAQTVAARIAGGFKKTCKEVIAKKGGMARS
ncbi:hypothetical protein AWC38_SpisGene24722 [Stylophora pistillata]|uniref:Tc1-like transposase DDE domain-containing protein n=1 Tax=Stylophora pistillata TaxID=50429 RepID=A0A2B4R4T2_STYPI|nr:hypothetical protein AWC38_SpisGene24722 [Stylophora pistillata]